MLALVISIPYVYGCIKTCLVANVNFHIFVVHNDKHIPPYYVCNIFFSLTQVTQMVSRPSWKQVK